jgi:hypothetical protein
MRACGFPIPYGNTEIRKYGNTEIRKYGNTKPEFISQVLVPFLAPPPFPLLGRSVRGRRVQKMVWVSKKEIDFIDWVSPPGIMIKKNIFFFI